MATVRNLTVIIAASLVVAITHIAAARAQDTSRAVAAAEIAKAYLTLNWTCRNARTAAAYGPSRLAATETDDPALKAANLKVAAYMTQKWASVVKLCDDAQKLSEDDPTVIAMSEVVVATDDAARNLIRNYQQQIYRPLMLEKFGGLLGNNGAGRDTGGQQPGHATLPSQQTPKDTGGQAQGNDTSRTAVPPAPPPPVRVSCAWPDGSVSTTTREQCRAKSGSIL